MMIKQKITLSVIAQRANLSIASVSRVLRQPNITSISTQKRVREAINSLNVETQDLFKSYQPQNASYKILIIDNQLQTNSFINYTLENELAFHGYHIVYFRFLNVQQQEINQMIHFTLTSSFDGILIINEAPYLKKLIPYRHTLPPIVLVNHFSLDFPCVYFDHLMMAYNITNYFASRAHKRIAILLGDENKASSNYLIQGYQQAIQRANLLIDNNYIIPNCFSYQHGKLAIKNLMESALPPTAVIFADHLCLSCSDNAERKVTHLISPYDAVRGALQQCNEMEIHIPHQLAFIYFSHDTQKQHNELDTLSCVNKPIHEMGKKSVGLLLQLLNKKTHAIKIANSIEAHLVFRHST